VNVVVHTKMGTMGNEQPDQSNTGTSVRRRAGQAWVRRVVHENLWVGRRDVRAEIIQERKVGGESTAKRKNRMHEKKAMKKIIKNGG
jgi:hypothetical protein